MLFLTTSESDKNSHYYFKQTQQLVAIQKTK